MEAVGNWDMPRADVQLRCRVAIVLALLTCCRCGGTPLAPSTSLVGDWSGRDVPLHFAFLRMRFTQQGSTISGVACYDDAGVGVFKDVSVSVQYPTISFDVALSNPTLSRARFSGQMAADGSIRGLFGFRDLPGSQMTLNRVIGTTSGELCPP